MTEGTSAVSEDSSTAADGSRGPSGSMAAVRVTLPAHLRTIAHVDGEVHLHVSGPVTQRSVRHTRSGPMRTPFQSYSNPWAV